jgi:DnaK suppressor protein
LFVFSKRGKYNETEEYAMDKEQRENYRRKLLELKEQITGIVQNIANDNLKSQMRENSGDLSGYSLHMADMGTDNFDREFALSIAGRENDILHLIEAALERIDEASYGLCENCEKPISDKRLDAIPYAAHCITCESELEKGRS